ncbi:hypothetical protein Salat_2154300 [Sesamum alatum]|uniref:Reverse transcriptase zinc-binding domain-containing protein n=1 Tax=Sesamum alatum TaxID=300844 RepID=A0AAE1Y1K0_9LAMI|nr:hypothetical protein Salat_2154300 [Sesamum alatum]
MWLGLRGWLATWDRLAFLQEDPSCSLCINTNEMTKHLFFECPFSACVWSDIRQWLGINRRMSTILNAVKWLKKEKTGSSVQNKARLLALACTVYSLWKHRNEVIFKGKAPCPGDLSEFGRLLSPSRRDNLCLPHFLSSVCTTAVFCAVGEFFSAAGEAALAASSLLVILAVLWRFSGQSLPHQSTMAKGKKNEPSAENVGCSTMKPGQLSSVKVTTTGQPSSVPIPAKVAAVGQPATA